jgi:hypothetical protein
VLVLLLSCQALELGAIPIMVRTTDEQKNFMNCKWWCGVVDDHLIVS